MLTALPEAKSAHPWRSYPQRAGRSEIELLFCIRRISVGRLPLYFTGSNFRQHFFLILTIFSIARGEYSNVLA
jgi:hypothetical protein